MNAPDCICSPGRLPLGAFCAGRDDLEREALHDDRISIRAPRAGCDDDLMAHAPVADVSIHAPRAGRDVFFGWRAKFRHAFQSTRPVWGATTVLPWRTCPRRYFNPRAPCGARRRHQIRLRAEVLISIHAPRVGRDAIHRKLSIRFQISIHAPRAGCDTPACRQRPKRMNFNPRTPCGVRREVQELMDAGALFQSTRPVWGATKYMLRDRDDLEIV